MSDCRAENTERREIERIFASVLGYFFIWKSLDLSYLWTGSINGIQLQIWGTWLFYAVLITSLLKNML